MHHWHCQSPKRYNISSPTREPFIQKDEREHLFAYMFDTTHAKEGKVLILTTINTLNDYNPIEMESKRHQQLPIST